MNEPPPIPPLLSETSIPTPCRRCRLPIDPDDAYCRHCGRRQSIPQSTLLYHPLSLIALMLFILGPFVFPLILRSPYLGRKGKTAMLSAVCAYTIAVCYFTWLIIAYILESYGTIAKELDVMSY